MKRVIPKDSSQGKIIAYINTQLKWQIDYQPKYGYFFISEKIGIPMNQYVEFFEDMIRTKKDDGSIEIKRFFHIIFPGDLEFGRRICPHEKHYEQIDFRNKDKAILSFRLIEFNNLLNIKKLVGKNDKENQAYKFNAYIASYHDMLGKEFLSRVRTGIAVDITQYYKSRKRKNPITTI